MCRAPIRETERHILRNAVNAATTLTDRNARPRRLREAETLSPSCMWPRSTSCLRQDGVDRGNVEVVGFHGQTILHRPERKLTVQIGDGAALAKPAAHSGGLRFPRKRCGKRRAGRAAGAGVSPRHGSRARTRKHPVVVVNIGGVANVTYHRRRGGSDRLRYRSRQCADGRIDAEPQRQADGRGRRAGCQRQGR